MKYLLYVIFLIFFCFPHLLYCQPETIITPPKTVKSIELAIDQFPNASFNFIIMKGKYTFLMGPKFFIEGKYHFLGGPFLYTGVGSPDLFHSIGLTFECRRYFFPFKRNIVAPFLMYNIRYSNFVLKEYYYQNPLVWPPNFIWTKNLYGIENHVGIGLESKISKKWNINASIGIGTIHYFFRDFYIDNKVWVIVRDNIYIVKTGVIYYLISKDSKTANNKIQ